MRALTSAILVSSLILLVNGTLSPLRTSTHGSPHKPRLCIFMVGRGMISIPEAVDLLRDPKLAAEMNFSDIDEERLNVLLCKVTPEAANAVKQQIRKQKCKEEDNCFSTVRMQSGFDSFNFNEEFFGDPSFLTEDPYGYTFPNNNFEMGFRQLQATFMDNSDDWDELDEMIEHAKEKKASKEHEKVLFSAESSESSSSLFNPGSEPIRLPREGEKRTSYERMRRSEREALGLRPLGDRYISPTRLGYKRNSPRAPAEVTSPLRDKKTSLDTLPKIVSLDTLPKLNDFLRTSRKYRGIENKDNFCYMISVIQALYHIPEIKKAVHEVDIQQVKETKREGVNALQSIFKHLDRFIHQTETGTELRRFGSTASVDITADDLIPIFKHQAGMQGDASEVLLSIFSLVKEVRNFFKFHRLELLMEDRPKGFIFSDRWQSDRLYQIKLLDFDYASLQDALDYGLAMKAELTLDTSDSRHSEFRSLERNKWVSEACLHQEIPCKIQCIKYTNLEDPGPFVAFDLIRYRSGHDYEPSLYEKPFIYSEFINIAKKKYRLQTVIIHTHADKGNLGHYFTITRTDDPKEEWVECNDNKVIVANRERALSYVTSATILIYAQEQHELSASMEAMRVSQDSPFDSKESARQFMIEQKFIERDRFGSNLVRLAAQQAAAFSHEFKPTADQMKYYIPYQSKYEKCSVRQALARHSVHAGEDLDDILADIAEEQKAFAVEVLQATYPDSGEAVKQAVEDANGCLEAAQIALAKKFKK